MYNKKYIFKKSRLPFAPMGTRAVCSTCRLACTQVHLYRSHPIHALYLYRSDSVAAVTAHAKMQNEATAVHRRSTGRDEGAAGVGR